MENKRIVVEHWPSAPPNPDAGRSGLIDAENHLLSYRAYGSGVDLFRAYLKYRESNRARAVGQENRLRRRLEKGLPIAKARQTAADIQMLHVLNEFDLVIGDLLRLCEEPPLKDDYLTGLRSALRLGPRQTPADSDRGRRRSRAVVLWIVAFNKMRDGELDLSDRQIAVIIGKEIGVNWRTALRYWQEYAAARPDTQGKWATDIRRQLRSSARKSQNKR